MPTSSKPTKPKATKSATSKSTTKKTKPTSKKSTTSSKARGGFARKKFVSKGIDMTGMNGEVLVIVESPTKAKTITKFLGKNYDIVASMGHITELTDKKMLDLVNNKFEPSYDVAEGKNKIVTDLKKLAKTHPKIIIATDEDREGEAIGRHLCKLLKLDPATTPRIVFHEITKPAIEEAIANPRTIDMRLVSSQKSRAVLDKLVGFTISPILWSKLKSGLSAGRVQSVATKLVVEREELINAFDPQEYWTMGASLKHQKTGFDIALHKVGAGGMNDEDEVRASDEEGETLKLGSGKFDKATIDSVMTQLSVTTKLSKSKSDQTLLISNDSVEFVLNNIKTKQTGSNPGIPFITSTLQQTASRMFGRPVKTVMQTAQKLYEQGFITYMRTDSPNLSAQSTQAITDYITSTYGKQYHQSRTFKSKSKNAQEAHEAIRPTEATRTPDQVRLGQYENKLYELIWARTIASQMTPAQYQQTTYIRNPETTDQQQWMCQGKVMEFDGYLKVYTYADRDDVILPEIITGTVLSSTQIQATQNHTKPPARFTEASLVKKMESLGIGRPSTYASIIQTIQDRLYVIKDKQKLLPTEIAFGVTKFLEEHFINLMDYQFTATLEDNLDTIAEGAIDRQIMLQQFWTGFEPHLTTAQQADRIKMGTGKPCPKCETGELLTKFSKSGNAFYGCSNYPDCDYITETDDAEAKLSPLRDLYEGKPCPAGGTMIVRIGRFGPFLSSSLYPEVKRIKSISAYQNEELSKEYSKPCTECNKGTMVVKSSRRGKFLSCDQYPDCKHTENLPKDDEEISEVIEGGK